LLVTVSDSEETDSYEIETAVSACNSQQMVKIGAELPKLTQK